MHNFLNWKFCSYWMLENSPLELAWCALMWTATQPGLELGPWSCKGLPCGQEAQSRCSRRWSAASPPFWLHFCHFPVSLQWPHQIWNSHEMSQLFAGNRLITNKTVLLFHGSKQGILSASFEKPKTRTVLIRAWRTFKRAKTLFSFTLSGEAPFIRDSFQQS